MTVKFFKATLFLIFQVFAFCALIGGGVYWSLLEFQKSLPRPESFKSCFVTSMHSVYLCPGSKDYVPLNKISSFLPAAIVSSEDGGFYSHKGFAWDALQDAARKAIETGRMKRGGSTITQQLAKNLFLSSEKTYFRKIREALITIEMERSLSKNDILELYLNVVEFGKNIYGVKAAAKAYFDKSPADLDVVESCFLAMILPNPVKYARSFYSKQLTPYAKSRMNQLIEDLYRMQKITDFDYLSSLHRMDTFLTADDVDGSAPESEDATE